MYDADEIAHYLVSFCADENHPISNLYLQAIMWDIQTCYCKATGSLLFNDEFEAWTYGPVLPDIYNEFTFYGGTRIEEDLYNQYTFDNIPNDVKKDLQFAARQLRELYPYDLVSKIKSPDSLWSNIYRDGEAGNRIIPNQMILEAAKANFKHKKIFSIRKSVRVKPPVQRTTGKNR